MMKKKIVMPAHFMVRAAVVGCSGSHYGSWWCVLPGVHTPGCTAHKHQTGVCTIGCQCLRPAPSLQANSSCPLTLPSTLPLHPPVQDDGVHTATNSGRNLFEDFSEVAERIGVYTAEDYCRNVEHLINRWVQAGGAQRGPQGWVAGLVYAEPEGFGCW